MSSKTEHPSSLFYKKIIMLIIQKEEYICSMKIVNEYNIYVGPNTVRKAFRFLIEYIKELNARTECMDFDAAPVSNSSKIILLLTNSTHIH